MNSALGKMIGVWFSSVVSALLVATAYGQASPTAEIRGVVLEVGTNLPVSEAEVRVQLENREVGAPLRFADAGAATADLQGAFRVPLDMPGSYHVRVQKDGYTDDGRNPMRSTPSNQATLTVDKDATVAEVRLLLARPGSLSGRVVDEETGEHFPRITAYVRFAKTGRPRRREGSC